MLSKLREKLPVYMLPNKILLAEQLPETGNGKLDYKKLQRMAADTYD